MPGANYMGGRRNAVKARVRDTTSRAEKTFFGQRRLHVLSKGLSTSKPQKHSIPREENLGRADILFAHARREVPPNSDILGSSFVPSPIHISPCTPRSRRRIKKRLKACPSTSSSNISRSAVLDALDVSEPIFLRGVLDRILTMPDLAGISRNGVESTVDTEGDRQVTDESSPLQRTKRKRSPSNLYEESDSLSNGRPSSSLRSVQSCLYENICTPIRKKYANSERETVHNKRTRTCKKLLAEEDIFSHWENISSYHRNSYVDTDDSGFSEDIQGDVQASPWSLHDHRSSRSLKCSSSSCTPYSTIDLAEHWNEGHTRLPTFIVFRGLKNCSAERPVATTTYPIEELTVYGTLFEQADPWDTIGQILGLSNKKPSKSPEEMIYQLGEIDESDASLGKMDEDLIGDESPQLPLIERRLIGLHSSPRCNSLELDRPEDAGIRGEVERVSDCLLGDIEKKRGFSVVMEAPDRRWDSAEESSYDKSVLDVPELQELDGLFMGPSLFDGLLLDENEED